MILKPKPFRKSNLSHPLMPNGGLWLMNENSGAKIHDLSENGSNGTLHSTLFWAAGEAGPSIDLATGWDRDIDIDPLNGFTGTKGTVIFSCYFDALANGDCPLRLSVGGSATQSIYSQYIAATDFTQILAYNAADGVVFNATSASAMYTTGGWAQYAMTWSNSAMRLYKNGILGVEDAASVNPPVITPDEIRTSTTAKVPINGRIGYIYLYKRVLSLSEIVKIYLNPFCMFERDEIELWVGSVGAVPVGMSGAMTTNTGYWGW